MTRIGIITGGGHIPSFHAGIDAIVRAAEENGDEVIGFRRGFRGAEEGDSIPLSAKVIPINMSGSIIGCARYGAEPEKVKAALNDQKIDALIVMGGDGHLYQANTLHTAGVNVVGWPKTMDNDLSGTFFTAGYITAVEIGAEKVRRAAINAQTNEKVHIMPTFGRNTDWVVAGVGGYGGADVIVPAEKAYHISEIVEAVGKAAEMNHEMYGRSFAVVVVGEQARIEGIEDHYHAVQHSTEKSQKYMKASPQLLSEVLQSAFKKNGISATSVETITYEMRDAPPTENDKKYAAMLGSQCYNMVKQGQFGGAAVINTNQNTELSLGIAPLEDVIVQRMMKREGFFDYEKLAVKADFFNYYQAVLGPMPDKSEFRFSPLKMRQSASEK